MTRGTCDYVKMNVLQKLELWKKFHWKFYQKNKEERKRRRRWRKKRKKRTNGKRKGRKRMRRKESTDITVIFPFSDPNEATREHKRPER